MNRAIVPFIQNLADDAASPQKLPEDSMQFPVIHDPEAAESGAKITPGSVGEEIRSMRSSDRRPDGRTLHQRFGVCRRMQLCRNFIPKTNERARDKKAEACESSPADGGTQAACTTTAE